MVGAFPVVGSSVVDSNTCSCLCLDVMPLSNLSRVESVLPRNSMGRKHRPRPGSLDLSSSFLDFSSVKAITRTKNLKKHRKMRRVIVDELAGQYEDNFGDVTSVRNFTIIFHIFMFLLQICQIFICFVLHDLNLYDKMVEHAVRWLGYKI